MDLNVRQSKSDQYTYTLEERNFTFPRSYSLIEFTDVTSPGSVHLYAEGGADANTRFRLLFQVVSVSIRSCIDPRFTISIDLYEKKRNKITYLYIASCDHFNDSVKFSK